MHVITNENDDDFYNARRDVTMMFVEWAEEGGRLSDASVWVRFDPLKFVDAIDDGVFNYGDVDIVRTGSALAILGEFFGLWEDERPLVDERTAPFVLAIREGRLSNFPDIVSLIDEALAREANGSLEPWFIQAIGPIYERYVRSYFARLAHMDRPASNHQGWWQPLPLWLKLVTIFGACTAWLFIVYSV